jgi:signal transduction histidine kinase
MPGDDALAQRLADLEALAEVGSWDFDVSTGTAKWSDGQCRLYGLEPGTEVTYAAWLDMVHPDDRSMVEITVDSAVEGGGELGFDHRFHRVTDGVLRWSRCRARVLRGPDGEAERIFGVSVDTTAEHDPASTLTDFIADAAHELRTPSAAIVQAVHALEFTEGADRDAVLAILERQANRLRALTANLVALAMAEAGPTAPVAEPVELAPAVADAAANAPAPDGRILDISGVAAGLVVWADPTGLDRVLVNLLTNAWRYGGPNVAVSAAPAGRRRVELRVADDGEGVPEAIRSSVFEAFQRGPQRHPEASGLGLAIVDRLVRRMGGAVRYEDAPSGGAVFVIELDAGP